MTRRFVVLGLIALGLVIGPAPSAMADPAGPTDYRSEVISVEPPAEGVSIQMIGGDAFLQLIVDPAREVLVTGYRGEPYLRFLPGGVVEINDAAPSRYLSEDRYGTVEVPAEATAEADPVWRQVGDDGSYAWHDHRTHWMNTARPAAEPGDQILEAAVPLVVDGQPTLVTVVSVWEPPPSPAVPVLGGIAGLVVAWVLGRSNDRRQAGLLAVLGVGAAGVSFAAYISLPPEAASSPVLWLVPVIAVALALVRMGRTKVQIASVDVFPSLLLLIWAIVRREWMTRSIIPTTIPSVDRFVTALVLAAAAVVIVVQGTTMLRPAGPSGDVSGQAGISS